MGSRIGNHIRVEDLGLRGVRGSMGSVSAETFSNNGVDLVASGFSTSSASGKEYLSHRGLGVRGEVLSVLEGVLVVSVKEIMSVHGVGLRSQEGVLGIAERKS